MIPAKIIKLNHSKQVPTKKALWGNTKFKNCCYCEKQIPIKEVTREHLIPKSSDGTIIAACCLECNRDKGCLLLIDWLIRLWADKRKEVDYRKERTIELRIRNVTKYLLILYPNEYDFIF